MYIYKHFVNIHDTMGVEQGGCASVRVYKLVNNDQLMTAQKSELGVNLGRVVNANDTTETILSSVGQSDDVALVSSTMSGLKSLLQLTKGYCDWFQVKLVSTKTKLLMYTTKHTELLAKTDLLHCPIEVGGTAVLPVDQAPHVGVVRSVHGNGPNIAARVSAHRGAVYGLLYAGLAKGHRANPHASLRVESVFGVSVLLSGLASLVLSTKEEQLIEHHYKVHLQRLLRLHQATPAPVVYFLSGCLPLPAQLHLRIFSLFGQLTRLNNGDNILAKRATIIFSSANPSTKSWFWVLRNLCKQYGLPHPASWLSSKQTKLQVKSKVKAAVLQFWLDKLRAKASTLTSLKYLRTGFLGLTRCHPLFRTCSSSPWEVEKASTQARLLSGRFRVEALTGHWVPWNRGGMCVLPSCWNTDEAHKGTVESFLLSCPSLSPIRETLKEYSMSYISNKYPHLITLATQCLSDDPVQFLLDCSTIPAVITAHQAEGEHEQVLYAFFKISRNYCHGLYKARINILRDMSDLE